MDDADRAYEADVAVVERAMEKMGRQLAEAGLGNAWIRVECYARSGYPISVETR